MTNDQKVVIEIRDEINTMIEPDRTRERALAETLRTWVKTEGDLALVAFALVGVELAASNDPPVPEEEA